MTNPETIDLARCFKAAAHYERLALLTHLQGLIAEANGGSAATRAMLMQPGFLTRKQAE